MSRGEARLYAMKVLSGMRQSMTPREIAREVRGSSWLPDVPCGYMLQSGRITVPFLGDHVFDVRKLLAEPQRMTCQPMQQEMFA